MKNSTRLPAHESCRVGGRVLLQVAAMLFALGTEAGAVAQGIPEVHLVSDPNRPFPVWVSANAAVDAAGRISTDLFSPGALITLNDLFETPPTAGCSEMTAVYELWVDPPDFSTLEKAARNSSAQLLLKVVGRGFGFGYGGIPGQLLEVQVSRALKGFAPRQTYFVFFPIAEFEAGPYKICKTDLRYPQPPEIGDEVLLFTAPDADLNEPLLDAWWGESVIVLRRNGEISFPRSFTRNGEPPRDRRELIRSVELAAAEEEQ